MKGFTVTKEYGYLVRFYGYIDVPTGVENALTKKAVQSALLHSQKGCPLSIDSLKTLVAKHAANNHPPMSDIIITDLEMFTQDLPEEITQ